MRAAGVSRDRPGRPLMARPYRPPALARGALALARSRVAIV